MRAETQRARHQYEVRLVMDDGSSRYVRRIDPPGGPKSPVGSSVCAVVDVTEAREAEAASQEAQPSSPASRG